MGNILFKQYNNFKETVHGYESGKIDKYHFFEEFLSEIVYTGCPNLILSFKIILWFSMVILIEKAVIPNIFVCYVYNLFVYVLTA